MVKPGKGLGVERLGVVARVVKETAIRSIGRVEVGQAHQIDPRTGETVGEEIGLLARQKSRGRDQCDSEEPRSLPVR